MNSTQPKLVVFLGDEAELSLAVAVVEKAYRIWRETHPTADIHTAVPALAGNGSAWGYTLTLFYTEK